MELESVQEGLCGTRKDKFMLQAKVGELRNSMKTVLLQNQQLKQDLKQSRLRKVGISASFLPLNKYSVEI